MKFTGIFSLVILSLILFISCSKGGDDGGGGGNPPALDCSAVPKSFSADVNPLIQTFCNQATCHNTGSVNGPGPLTNYAQVSAAKTQIRAAVASGIMPKNTTLTTEQKNKILCWIDAGAQNN